MEMFVATLEPFSTLTDVMSMEKDVGVCSLYPLLKHIKDICERPVETDLSDDLKAASAAVRSYIWKYIDDRLVAECIV